MALSGGSFGRGRRVLGLGEGLLAAVVLAALVIAAVYAATRPAARVRWDLTRGATYTLSEQTHRLLDELPSPVRVTTVFRPEHQVISTGLTAVQLEAAEYVRHLLAEYEVAAGGQIELVHLDPHADRSEVDEVVRRHRVTRFNVVLLECEGRARQVFLEQLVTIDRGLASPEGIRPAELRQYHGEGPLTSALLGILDADPPQVAFLEGQGEGSIRNFENGFGLSVLADSLRAQGFVVSTLDMAGRDAVPDHVDVLAVVSPRQPYSARLVSALRAFHEGGGALLLALDPWFEDAELDGLLYELGVLRERAMVTREDPLADGSRRADVIVRRFDAEHPITAPIAEQGLFAMIATSGGLVRAPDARPQVGTPALVRSPDDVFGDEIPPAGQGPGNYLFDEGRERRGARTVMMAVEGAPGRAVVLGGTQFLTDNFLAANQGGPGNMDLALNSVGWLAHRESLVDVPPREVYESRVDLFEDERRDVFLYVVVFMPLAGALLGLLVWFVRRR